MSQEELLEVVIDELESLRQMTQYANENLLVIAICVMLISSLSMFAIGYIVSKGR